jgi:hypothetical protein
MHRQSGVAIDTSLKAVKDLFLQEGTAAHQTFPSSQKTLMRRVSRLGQKFWPNVKHRTCIDLSSFGLDNLSFQFFNPVFGWLIAAARQRADDMHWKPKPQYDSSGARVYGAGVQSGKGFEKAYEACPPGIRCS